MTPQQLKAMKMALEALKLLTDTEQSFGALDYGDNAITAIEEVLAEHAMREVQRLGQEIEQEPVFTYEQVKAHIQVAMMSTTPPQRKPLTEQEIGAILEDINAFGTRLYTFARAIEAAHGIKENT
jgi:hypothetical protein